MVAHEVRRGETVLLTPLPVVVALPVIMIGIARTALSRFNGPMPQLIRRRDPETHQETWHVYYGDVRVDTISMRSGIPG